MRFSTATVISSIAALASAYTTPDYNKSPNGNAIVAPGLNEQVPEGAPFHIKWEPTVGKTVSLVLLRGPSSNVVPLETIVESIPNSGEYTWTPGTNLDVDTTHYGLLLVVEDEGANHGAYQWSTQFGISKASGSSGPKTIVTVIDDQTTTYCPEEASSTAAPTTTGKATITTVIDDVTTTYCPEEDATSTPVAPSSVAPTPSAPAPSSVAPTVAPSPSAPADTTTVWEDETTTYCPEEESSTVAPSPSAPSSVAPSPSVPSSVAPTVAPSPSAPAPTTTGKATIVTVINDQTTTYCPEEDVTTPAAVPTPAVSSTPVVSAAPSPSSASSYSTIWESTLLTTTYCPEETSSAGVAPTSMPMVPSSSMTRRPLKPTSSVPAVPSSVAPVGTSAPTGSASATPSVPAYNAAGRTTASFGAVAAAMVALMAF